ncbi:Uma2 family endonuclease [Streptomyces sp. AK08-02]|uniref:Uma2 family endonuclease n=1 Tax=Streptomyces sp. AK08-02 TaxID=3028654 RepID=UPI0029A30AFE|nr:Uma2 family endonuclease [Streptomyces sp. AK08-02]MDX3749206.1 Uma2 family endonuclease [Streptomyces sp. AK08-02]
MSGLTEDQLRRAGQEVLAGFLELDLPVGFRAQLVEGQILLAPLPDGRHEHCLSEIGSQIYLKSRTGIQLSGNKGLKLPSSGAHPDDHVIPDSTVAPDQPRLFRGAPPWMPCAGVALVVEVTHLYAWIDRETKPRCYARGKIPLYLLVDRDAASVTLFSDPGQDDYSRSRTVPFGKPLALPAPFAFDLDTTEFL